jgi:hypothetical protein
MGLAPGTLRAFFRCRMAVANPLYHGILIELDGLAAADTLGLAGPEARHIIVAVML